MEIITRAEARERGLKRYFTGKQCGKGHIAERLISTTICIACNVEKGRRHRAKTRSWMPIDALEANRSAKAAAFESGYKRYSIPFPCVNSHRSDRWSISGVCIACDESYRSKSRPARKETEARKKSRKIYRESNKKKISARHVELRRVKRANDPVFAMAHRMRALVAAGLKLKGFAKRSKTTAIIGCSWPEFSAHIERQFLPGMTWENRALWHIDHIVPLATAKTEADVLALNHFTNLRPMWARDNLKKNAQVTHLL